MSRPYLCRNEESGQAKHQPFAWGLRNGISANAAPTGAPRFASADTSPSAARSTHGKITIGVYIDRTEAEQAALQDALDRYLREVVPGKRYPKQERSRIARWQKHDLTWSLRSADLAKMPRHAPHSRSS
uniref:Putative phage integrase n=1 Tax=Ralstonia solanacearum TaxID=305 RepID=A0A0S4TRQ8_RALSL|nr:putative phage integrase [Ralstonia solanacearum]